MSDEGTTIPQMRERISELEKTVKASEDKAAAAESKARLFEARDAFREAGYNPKHAELYVKTSTEGDITQENVATFADEYGLAPAGEGTAGTGETNEGAGEGEENGASEAGMSGMGRAGSGSGEGGAASAGNEPMTHDDWMKLNKENPAAAREAARKGRVELSEGNYYSQLVNRN